ncbi:MAG: hypothetical protein GX221_04435 [Candidatus Riflebacteria bacterium]|nr:hypothetical protein [Candidatus Riflebacteria bacterium]
MIRIITGPVNSGKTSYLRGCFEKRPEVRGFLSVKTRDNEQNHIGYDLLDLHTGKSCPFIRKPEFLISGWQEANRIGERYSFSSEGFVFARDIFERALKEQARAFCLDEVGKLELQGDGFAQLLEELLNSSIQEKILVIRESLLTDIRKRFYI